MTVRVRNFVACDEVIEGDRYSLQEVRFRWPTPPDGIAFWVDILNPSEAVLTVRLEVFRLKELVGDTEELLVPPGNSFAEAAFTISTAEFLKKSYTVVAVVNDVAAAKLDLDFGASDA